MSRRPRGPQARAILPGRFRPKARRQRLLLSPNGASPSHRCLQARRPLLPSSVVEGTSALPEASVPPFGIESPRPGRARAGPDPPTAKKELSCARPSSPPSFSAPPSRSFPPLRPGKEWSRRGSPSTPGRLLAGSRTPSSASSSTGASTRCRPSPPRRTPTSTHATRSGTGSAPPTRDGRIRGLQGLPRQRLRGRNEVPGLRPAVQGGDVRPCGLGRRLQAGGGEVRRPDQQAPRRLLPLAQPGELELERRRRGTPPRRGRRPGRGGPGRGPEDGLLLQPLRVDEPPLPLRPRRLRRDPHDAPDEGPRDPLRARRRLDRRRVGPPGRAVARHRVPGLALQRVAGREPPSR